MRRRFLEVVVSILILILILAGRPMRGARDALPAEGLSPSRGRARRAAPASHTVTACVTYGDSLRYIR